MKKLRRRKRAGPKHWFFKFEHRVWLADPNLRRKRRQPALRGIWIDALCHMVSSGGVLEGTVEELADLCDCTSAQMKQALTQLASQEIATVLFDGQDARNVTDPVTPRCNAVVTLINRRLKREADHRAKSRARVRKYRGKAQETEAGTDDVTHLSGSDVTPYRRRIELKRRELGESGRSDPSQDRNPSGAPTLLATHVASGGAAQNGEHKLTPEQVDLKIYQAYPRQTGRRKALEAIGRAVARLSAKGIAKPRNHILARTRAYAAIVQPLLADDPDLRRWIPHPATWFNQDRFDDDPSEWTVALRRQDEAAPSPRTQAAERERMKDLIEQMAAPPTGAKR